jgi:hypothetical protein
LPGHTPRFHSDIVLAEIRKDVGALLTTDAIFWVLVADITTLCGLLSSDVGLISSALVVMESQCWHKEIIRRSLFMACSGWFNGNKANNAVSGLNLQFNGGRKQ